MHYCNKQCTQPIMHNTGIAAAHTPSSITTDNTHAAPGTQSPDKGLPAHTAAPQTQAQTPADAHRDNADLHARNNRGETGAARIPHAAEKEAEKHPQRRAQPGAQPPAVYLLPHWGAERGEGQREGARRGSHTAAHRPHRRGSSVAPRAGRACPGTRRHAQRHTQRNA